MAISQINDSNFQSEVLNSPTPVVVDFYADWCNPCKRMAPILEDAAAHLDGKCKICKLNVDESRGTALEYGVQSIPTMILFRNGQAEKQLTGLQTKTILMEWIGM